MREKSSAERDDKTLGQDLLGLVLSGVGGLFTVSLFLALLGWQPKEKLWTAPVIGLIDVLGQVPGLFLCVALAVLGTVLFLRSKEVPAGRHVLGILGATLGLSLCLARGGGAIGGAVPDVLPGKGGLVLGLAIGLTVLLASVWVTWLGSAGRILAQPGPRVPISSTPPEESEGVSAAEAAALVASLGRARELPASTPKTPAADVRLRGGVPQGARALGDDDEPQEPRAGADARARAPGPGARADAPVAFPPRQPAGEDLATERPEPRQDPAGAGDEPLGRPEPLTRRIPAPLPGPPVAFEVEVKAIGGTIGRAAASGERAGPARPSWELARPEEDDEPEPGLDFDDAADETSAALGEDGLGDDGAELFPLRRREPAAELEDGLSEATRGPATGEAEVAPAVDFDEEEEEDDDDEDDDDDEEDDEEEDEDAFASDLAEVEALRGLDLNETQGELELEDEAAPRASSPAAPETIQPGLFDTQEDAGLRGSGTSASDVEDEPAAALPAEVAKKPRRRPARPRKTAPPAEERSTAAAETPAEPDYVLTPREASSGPGPAGPGDEGFEDLVHRAGCLILEENRVAVSMLERKFDMDFDRACLVLDRLQQQGLIGPYMGGRTRDILLSREEWMAQAP